jgi:PTS system N-acetylglucosamine-specific IIC component
MSAIPLDGLPPAPTSSNTVLVMLQRIGRSLMLTIAIMPAAGVFIRLGSDDVLGARAVDPQTHAVLPDQHGLYLADRWHPLIYLEQIFAAAGGAIFHFLPLLFAIGVAVGYARRSDGSTALAAAVGYLVFNEVSIEIFNQDLNRTFRTNLNPDQSAAAIPDSVGANPTYALGGIVIGITAALLYQRYHRIKLPAYLTFFGGRRFVPIITAVAAIGLGVIFGLLWQFPAAGIKWIGEQAANNGTVGAGIFGVVNRLLLPFGLHHVVNNVAWFQIGAYTPNGGTTAAHGDLVRFFAHDKSAGMFMTGFFPIMMFALPAAGLAMVRQAHPDQRKRTAGILLSAALTSFLTGVTEPIEFAFLFAAPVLFGIHALLTGVSLALCQALGIHDGFSFSAGLVDYLFNYDIATKPLLIIPIGIATAAVYYVVFSFAIKRFKLMTPGREE